MQRKILSLLLMLVMLVSMLQLTVVADAANKNSGAKARAIDAMNALLIGSSGEFDGFPKEVAKWSDEQVFDYVYLKLSTDPFYYDKSESYLDEIGLKMESDSNGMGVFDYGLVQKITRDSLGRDFPQKKVDYIYASGDKVYLMLADGGGVPVLSVQDFTKQGNTIVAVGTSVIHYNPFSEFLGYFRAEFRENPSSLYGYTLTALYEIEGNQRFDLSASASSELVDSAGGHPAKNLIDGKKTTAWVESANGVGVGEWVKLETRDGSKMDLSAIELLTGYHKSEDLLSKNGAPTKLLIECDGGYRQETWLNGAFDVGIVVLDQPQLTSFVRITIVEAQAGRKYEDTCISEIRMLGMDTEAYFEKLNGGAKPTPVPETTSSANQQNGGEANSSDGENAFGSFGNNVVTPGDKKTDEGGSSDIGGILLVVGFCGVIGLGFVALIVVLLLCLKKR